MAYKYRKWFISDRMMVPVTRYITEGRPVGDFLRAVISNDLKGAIGHADDDNVENLPAYCAYFHNQAPSDCYGSPEKYKVWVEQHAAERKSREETGV